MVIFSSQKGKYIFEFAFKKSNLMICIQFYKLIIRFPKDVKNASNLQIPIQRFNNGFSSSNTHFYVMNDQTNEIGFGY